MSDQRSLGTSMYANAEYVENELPNVYLSEEMREKVKELCSLWKETYFDLGGDTSAGLLAKWVQETLDLADVVVRMLDAASVSDPRYSSAYVLVSESAANILKAYGRKPT